MARKSVGQTFAYHFIGNIPKTGNKKGRRRSRLSSWKKRRRRRKEKRWKRISFCCSSREHNRGKKEGERKRGRGGRRPDGFNGQVSLFHAFAFWTTATKGAQSVGISEPCAISLDCSSRPPYTRAPNMANVANAYRAFVLSPRAAVFLTSHRVRGPTFWFTNLSSLSIPRTFRSLSLSLKRFPLSFHSRPLQSRSRMHREKGRGTVFSGACSLRRLLFLAIFNGMLGNCVEVELSSRGKNTCLI